MDSKCVFAEAIQRPADARVALAGEPLASVDPREVDTEREAAWAAEIRVRLEEYERGEVNALPAVEVLARLHAVARGRSAD